MLVGMRASFGTILAAFALALVVASAEPGQATEARCDAALAAGNTAGQPVTPPRCASKDAPLRIQGSTTFNAAILAANLAAIERMTGGTLEIVANKSSWGLLALLEGRADVAMISAPLEAEIMAARKLAPKLDYSALLEFRILTTRIAFAAHPSNPVQVLPIETVARLLKGEIANWSVVGGADVPVRVVAVKEGGGTVAAVRAQLLGDVALAGDAVRLESANHVLKVVAQEPGAIGIAQLGLIRKAGLREIATDRPVEQPLSYITAGQPSVRVLRVIDATRFATVNDGD